MAGQGQGWQHCRRGPYHDEGSTALGQVSESAFGLTDFSGVYGVMVSMLSVLFRLSVPVACLHMPTLVPQQVPMQELKKKEGHTSGPNSMLKRFRVLSRIFAGRLPGDLKSALTSIVRKEPWFKRAPALYAVFLMLKSGPWRDALLSEAKLAFPKSNGAPPTTRAIHRVIVQAIHAVDLSQHALWSAHCGKNLSHHHGPLACLQRVGILNHQRKVRGVLGVHGRCIHVGKNTYMTPAYTEHVKVCLKGLAMVSQAILGSRTSH